MNKRKRFEKTIYAIVDDDPDGCIVASETFDEFEDGDLVGVYELKAVLEKGVTHELRPTRRKS